MKCHYEGTGCLEGRCMGTKEIDPCIGYERCTAFKSEYKTNADRIRAMSDEELAAYLVYHNPYSTEEFCLKWLKQPVKDGEGDA